MFLVIIIIVMVDDISRINNEEHMIDKRDTMQQFQLFKMQFLNLMIPKLPLIRINIDFYNILEK